MTPLRFAPSHRRHSPRENIVPMINVVFLLLIFFLMTAQIAPPVPFDVTPPQSQGAEPPRAPDTLHVAADGALFFNGITDAAAMEAAAANSPLSVRADRALPVVDLARLMADLGARGVTEMSLITDPAR